MQFDVYKRTHDDWCPNIDRHYVMVGFAALPNGTFVVSVAGADDLVLNRFHETEAAAMTVFMQLIGMEYVNIRNVRELGLE